MKVGAKDYWRNFISSMQYVLLFIRIPFLIHIKATLNFGIGTVGVTSILFGLLDKIDNGKVFLGLSFALRIIEACGNSGFLTGSFAMIAKEFPENVATMFAILETFFGIGMILGPTIGGALYEAGGFTLPFTVLGG